MVTIKFTFCRVYEIEAQTQQQAIDRLVEAYATGLLRTYHVMDKIQAPGGDARRIELQVARWLALHRRRLGTLEQRLNVAAARYFARAGK